MSVGDLNLNPPPKRPGIVLPVVVATLIFAMGYVSGHERGWAAAVTARDNAWMQALGAALAPKEPV